MIFRVTYITPYLNRRIILFKRSGLDLGHSGHVCHRLRYVKKKVAKIRAKSCTLLTKEVNKNSRY